MKGRGRRGEGVLGNSAGQSLGVRWTRRVQFLLLSENALTLVMPHVVRLQKRDRHGGASDFPRGVGGATTSSVRCDSYAAVAFRMRQGWTDTCSRPSVSFLDRFLVLLSARRHSLRIVLL